MGVVLSFTNQFCALGEMREEHRLRLLGEYH